MTRTMRLGRRGVLGSLLLVFGLGVVALMSVLSRGPVRERAAPAAANATQSRSAVALWPQANETGAIAGYRSSMLAGETSPTPRKDSMGMDMVPVYAADGSLPELSERARAMARVETVVVRRQAISREIRAVGKVQFNETGLANITSRVDGYAERLFVDYTGVEVKAGDHLVELYSPDLLVAQQELLVALAGRDGTSLVESAKRKLLFLGLTAAQVELLASRRELSDRITLFSPIRGTVIEKLVVQEAMVKPGDVLYRLANLESVWVYLDIYESELPWVQYGQTVDVDSEALPGHRFGGRVWFISPVVDEESRTVKVLVNIDNRELKLKPGMYVSAVVRAQLLADGNPAATGAEGQWTCPMHPHILQAHGGQCPVCGMTLVQIPGTRRPPARDDEDPLAVPVTAVLDSGIRKIVYVEHTPGYFAPVEIVTGPRADDTYPVIEGLEAGDTVATRGNFLLDSQLQIRGLPSLFYREGQAPVTGPRHGATDPDAGRPGAHDRHEP